MTVNERMAPGDEAKASRLRAVWRQLDRVCDPELDEPITDMGFVENVEIDAGKVSVQYDLEDLEQDLDGASGDAP